MAHARQTDYKADPDEALSQLNFIEPGDLTQEEWLKITMSAKSAGVALEDWDAWNRRDPARYDEAANRRRWESIDPSSPGGVTEKTLYAMARDRGWRAGAPTRPVRTPRRDTQRREEFPRLVLPEETGGTVPSLSESAKLDPAEQLRRYMRALHSQESYVLLYLKGRPNTKNPSKPTPSGEVLYRVGDIIENAGKVLEHVDRRAGAWVTVNEVDPEGFRERGRKADVAASWRYALLEADEAEDGSPLSLEAQAKMATRLRLPAVAAVWSGSKSLHLICRIDADGPEQYRARVEYLMGVCRANGFKVDANNKDALRLTRLPGATRGDGQQTLIGANHAAERSFADWKRFVDEHAARERGAGADEPTRGGRREGDGTGAPIHRRMADTLLDEFGACLIDGTPAVRDGQTYHHENGWASWERALVQAYPSSRTHDRNEAINLAKCECRRVEQAPPKYVAFRNGVLDIESGELDTQGVYSILNVIPHAWNPEAASSVVDNALAAWADGDGETLARLEECAGHCLDRSSELQYFWVLVGEGGNGKSLFTRTIGNAIGPENFSAIQPDELDRRFQGLSIAGKLACLADDASSQSMTAGMVATLKRYTGGATVRTDVKGRDAIEFVPYATVVVSYNHFPRVTGCDGGFMRRVQPVVFSHMFKPGAGGLKAARELMSEKAAERLLVRAVGGLKRLRENGEPTPSSRAQGVVADIRLENDTFEAWRLDEGITADFLDQRSQSDVLADYHAWCEQERVTPLSSRRFYARVKREWAVKTATKRENGRPRKIYEVP